MSDSWTQREVPGLEGSVDDVILIDTGDKLYREAHGHGHIPRCGRKDHSYNEYDNYNSGDNLQAILPQAPVGTTISTVSPTSGATCKLVLVT